MRSQLPYATHLMSRRRLMQLAGGTTLALAMSACASPIPPEIARPATGADQTPRQGGSLRFALNDALTMYN